MGRSQFTPSPVGAAMSDDRRKPVSEADAALEREVRAERKFTLSEAIGRLAGPGAMKGVSPVARSQQAAAEIQEYLDRHLTDAAGVLPGVVLRFVRESDLLQNSPDPPLVVLAAWLRRILGSEQGLKELTREADVEWGRVFGERPYFEKDGRPSDPDDPYTLASVRAALVKLVERLPEPTGGER
jgi:hypothetical protein